MNRIIQIIALIAVGVSTTLAATFTVTRVDGNDWTPQAGSFAQAILNANAAGAGPHSIVFSIPNNSIVVVDAATPNLTSSNVTIDGGTKNITIRRTASWDPALRVSGNNNTIKNLTFINNSTQIGALSIVGDDNIIQDNKFPKGGLWIGEQSPSVNRANNNQIINTVLNELNGSLVIDGDNNTVNNLDIKGVFIVGIFSPSDRNANNNTLTNSIIHGDKFNSWDAEAFLLNGDRNRMTNVQIVGGEGGTIQGEENIFENSSMVVNRQPNNNAGLFIEGPSRANQVLNSVFTLNTGSVIVNSGNNVDAIKMFNGSNNNIVRGNTILGNYWNGILLRQNSTGNTVENNQVMNNLNHGIFVYDGSNNNSIVSNTVSGSGFSGVSVHSSKSNQVYQNKTFNNTYNGIAFEGGATLNKAFENTVFNEPNGFLIEGSSQNEIYSNSIGVDTLGNSAGNSTGILIHIASSNNFVGKIGEPNVITNSTNNAIQIDGSSSDFNTIRGNKTSCNGGKGILLSANGNDNYGLGKVTINWALSSATSVISGKAPTVGAIIDVYIADTACHTTCRAGASSVIPSANAQGMTWVGQTTAFENTKGEIVWDYTIPGGSKLSWNNAIVTATHPNNGNTSEFSICEYDAPCTAPTSVVLSAPDLTLCADQFPATITSTTNVSNYRYTWLKGSQVVSSGLNLTTLSIATAGAYTLRVADPLDTNSCKLTSAAIVITENTPPSTLNFSVKADSICAGNNAVTFTVAPSTAGSTYQWKIGTAVASGKTKASETLDLSSVAAGTSVTISVTETTAAGCVGTPVTNSVKVNPLPVSITVGQQDTICKGTKATYTATPSTTGSTYQWTIPLSGTIEVGQTTNEVRVDFASATAGKANITVVETNKFGCVATTPASLPIEVFDNPVLPNLSGDFTPTCESAGNVYKISNYNAANSYVWTVPSGSTITAQNADSIVVTFGNVSGTVTLKAFSPAGCESSLQSQPITLQSCNLKAAFEIVPDSVCIGEEVLVVNNSTGDIISWTWDFDTAAVNSASPATFDGANPGAVTYATAGTKYISLSVNDGVNVRDTILSVVVSPLPTPISIDGAASVCAEAKGAVYSVVHEVNNTYSWSVTGADVISESANKDSVFVNIGATTPANVSVIKTNEFGCTQDATLAVTVNENPVTPTINPIELCEGTTNHVVSVAAGNYTYNWSVDATTAILTAGQGTNEVVLDVLDASGSIQLEVIDNATSCTDINGASSATITINPLPKDFTLVSTDEQCTEAKAVVYEVENGLPNSTYIWTYPSSVTVLDDGSASISVDFGTTPETVNITVKEVTEKGCEATFVAPLSVEVKGAPAPLVIEGSDIGCNTQTGTFSVAASAGSTYNWSVLPSDGAQIISGNGTSSIEVLFTNVAVTLSVSESNSAGCNSPAPDTKTLTIPGELGKITLSGGSLTVCDVRDTANSPAVLSFSASNSTGYFLPSSGAVLPADAASIIQVDYNVFELLVDTVNGAPRYKDFKIIIDAESECETRRDTFPINVRDAEIVKVSLADNILCLGNSSYFAPSSGIFDPSAQYVWSINGVQQKDTASFYNLLFPEKDDTVIARYITSPGICVNTEKSTIETTAYSYVVSRPGATALAIDLETMERPRYEVNAASLLQGSYFSTNDVLDLEKIEDVYALQDAFDRATAGYIFPKGKTSADFNYQWEWKIVGAHDSTYSDTGIVNYNRAVALPAVIGRPEQIMYRVSVSNGVCTDYDSVEVKFNYLPWPPNAFSPNNDSFFDKWEIRNVDKYPGTEVKIFNRWGVELLTITNYDQAENWWDGTKNGDALPTGTYFYWVDFKDGGDPVTGSVSIIK